VASDRVPCHDGNVDGKPQPLALIASGRVGLIKAGRVMAFMVQWQIVRDDQGGDEPTLEQYAAWWNCSIRTAYREQALFRQAFPGEVSPTRLLDLAAHAWVNRPSRRPSPQLLGQVAVPL
jgi:hypothetical protein